MNDAAPGISPQRARAMIIGYVAAELQLDAQEVFTDPLARRMVGLRGDPLSGLWPRKGEHRPSVRLQMALCHRYADDAVVSGMHSGTVQLIVVHPGLDTLCYRRPYPGMRLLELDNRQTQVWKQQQLACAGIEKPQTLRYVEVDEQIGLNPARLDRAGYNPILPTMVVWLDTITFFDGGVVDQTLHVLGRHTGPLELILDYVQPPEFLPEPTRDAVTSLASLMKQSGMPLRSLFAPHEIADRLRRHGFDPIDDFSWNDMIHMYVPDKADTADPVGARLIRAGRGIPQRPSVT